jgi:hypothetical protein
MVHSRFIEIVEESFNEPHRCLVCIEPGIDNKAGPVNAVPSGQESR